MNILSLLLLCSGIKWCLWFLKLSIFHWASQTNLVLLRSNKIFRRAHCIQNWLLWNLSNQYFINFIQINFIWITTQNGRSYYESCFRISEPNYLTKRGKLEHKRKCIYHFLHIHIFRKKNLNIIASESCFELKMHLDLLYF